MVGWSPGNILFLQLAAHHERDGAAVRRPEGPGCAFRLAIGADPESSVRIQSATCPRCPPPQRQPFVRLATLPASSGCSGPRASAARTGYCRRLGGPSHPRDANPTAASAATAKAAQARPSRTRRFDVTMAGRPTRSRPGPPIAVRPRRRGPSATELGSLARQRETIRSSAGGVSGAGSDKRPRGRRKHGRHDARRALAIEARWPVSSS